MVVKRAKSFPHLSNVGGFHAQVQAQVRSTTEDQNKESVFTVEFTHCETSKESDNKRSVLMKQRQPKDITPLVIRCKKLFQEGQTWEPVLQFLKEETGSRVQSILVISKALNIDLNTAKLIVHYSATWSGTRSATEMLHEELGAAIKALNYKSLSDMDANDEDEPAT